MYLAQEQRVVLEVTFRSIASGRRIGSSTHTHTYTHILPSSHKQKASDVWTNNRQTNDSTTKTCCNPFFLFSVVPTFRSASHYCWREKTAINSLATILPHTSYNTHAYLCVCVSACGCMPGLDKLMSGQRNRAIKRERGRESNTKKEKDETETKRRKWGIAICDSAIIHKTHSTFCVCVCVR